MDSIFHKLILATALILGVSGIVYANPVTYNFTTSNFFGTGVPIDLVSGSFSVDSGVLTSIDLTIDTYTYTTSDVTFTPNLSSNNLFMLYGNLNGSSIQGSTNDFWLRGYLTTDPSFYDFAYSTQNTSSVWQSETGSITVPEPTSLALLGIGLIGLGLNQKRKHKTRSK